MHRWDVEHSLHGIGLSFDLLMTDEPKFSKRAKTCDLERYCIMRSRDGLDGTAASRVKALIRANVGVRRSRVARRAHEARGEGTLTGASNAR